MHKKNEKVLNEKEKESESDWSEWLNGYLWIYSPRHNMQKVVSRPNFSYLSGTFPSCVRCNLMVNIVRNRTKNTKLPVTLKSVTASFAA